MHNFIVVIMLTLFTSCTSTRVQEKPSSEDILNLSFKKFDQTLGEGWRMFADNRSFIEAAHLIDTYTAKHVNDLKDNEQQILRWHAGQMYAIANDYVLARARFAASFATDSPKSAGTFLWNEYVHATIAFLDKDLAKLQNHRERMVKGPKYFGQTLNLDVVDGLIRCFDKPYTEAYSKACRD